MKHQLQINRTGRRAIAVGTMAMLVVLGGIVRAEMKPGNIQLKQKDQPIPAQPQTQTQTQSSRIDPFRDMLRMQREIDQMFGNALDPYIGMPDVNTVWNDQALQPAMDLTEKPDAYTVQMELPGMDKSEINVEIKDHVLTVGAEHKTTTEQDNDKGKVLVQERSDSAVRRQVVLPKSVDSDKVTADYKNGVLTITLPKTEKDQAGHQIEIK